MELEDFDHDAHLFGRRFKPKVRITYEKDSSGAGGSDTAYIRNLRINGVLVTAQNSLNTELAGTYTTSDSTQVIVGMGGALQIGENFYGYTVVDENTISATIEGTYKEITLDKSAGTCTIGSSRKST